MTVLKPDLVRAAVTILLDRLEQACPDGVELEHDYFWDVPPDVRYDTHETPDRPTLGQISADIESLEQIVSGKSEPVQYGPELELRDRMRA